MRVRQNERQQLAGPGLASRWARVLALSPQLRDLPLSSLELGDTPGMTGSSRSHELGQFLGR